MDVFSFAFAVLSLVAAWKVYMKMGYQGWEAIVPFYSSYVLFKTLYGNGWKMLLMLIPIYNIYVVVKLSIDLAHAFGKSTAFGFGILLLNAVFMCIMAFDDSEFILPYQDSQNYNNTQGNYNNQGNYNGQGYYDDRNDR